jgi:ribonuclease Z
MYKEYRFLVDCGEGTQRQILKSGVGFRRLNRILLTHGHLDHILGLGGLLSTFTRWEAIESIEVWGGRSTLERVHDLLYGVVLRGATPHVSVDLLPVTPGVLMDDDDFEVRAFRVAHRGPDSFGYSFEEKARRPFLNQKAEALNVPRGPERRMLVQGQNVTLADGRVITPDDVLGVPIEGTKVCITGDTGSARWDELVGAMHGADVIVSEATYLNEEVDLARQYGHLTARQAAELATDAGARYLILTHISRRHREKDVLAEAQSVFPNTVVARDFDHYRIKRDSELEKVD